MAIPAFFQHALGTSDTPSGTITVFIQSEVDSTDLPTIPAGIANSLSWDGYLTKTMSVKNEGSQLNNITCDYTEDYSVYPEGFWFKLLTGGELEIHVLLNEGFGNTEFCWLRCVSYETEERSLVTDDIIREGSIQWGDAFFVRLSEITSDELFTYLDQTNPLYVTIGGVRHVTILNVFSSMLFLAFSQSIDNNDIGLESQCLQYYDGATWRAFNELSFAYTVVGLDPNEGFFAIWNNWGWNCSDIFRQICLEHVLYPEINVDVSNDDHKIHLVAMGSSFGYSEPPSTIADAPEESTIYVPRHPLYANNIDIQGLGGNHSIYVENTPVSLIDLPPNTNFDVSLTIYWESTPSGANRVTPVYVSGGVASIISQARHYLGNNTWSSGTANSTFHVASYINTHWGSAMATMYGYERTYFGLAIINNGTTTEHIYSKFRSNSWVVINDGVSDKRYLPIEIGKNLQDYRTKIVWRARQEDA